MPFTPFLTRSLIRSAEIKDPFFMELIGHLTDEITQRGYGMFLQNLAYYVRLTKSSDRRAPRRRNRRYWPKV
jgi:DNA-binding LacI/PurR family transcriptional regulator